MGFDLTATFELVGMAKAGDGQALERLIARYYDRVRRIVRVRLGACLSRELDCDDILQETFVSAVQAFQQFELRTEASLINWLSKIAENEIRGQLDRLHTDKRNPDREVPLDTAVPDENHRSPSEAAMQREDVRLVEECLSELPEHYREIIILRNYAGCTWKEVAEESGRPSENAARQMHVKALLELDRSISRRSSK